MSKRRRTTEVEKWIKQGRGSGIGADYQPLELLSNRAFTGLK